MTPPHPPSSCPSTPPPPPNYSKLDSSQHQPVKAAASLSRAQLIPPPPFSVPPPPGIVPPPPTNGKVSSKVVYVPPPPSSEMTNISEQRKKKKRFKLIAQSSSSLSNISNQNSFVPKAPNVINDILLIPHIHYGLNRNQTCLALLDRDNILTHSPTLVSFGGSSFEMGYQTNVLMLDLDPVIKDGSSLGTSYEYEWKQVPIVNPEVLAHYNFTSANGNMIYSNRNQAIYVFFKGWTKPRIAELCLKTLKWTFTYFSICNHYPDLHLAIPYDEEQFILCTIGGTDDEFNFALFKFSALQDVFENENLATRNLVGNLSNSLTVKLPDGIYSRMIAPLASENKAIVYSFTSSFTILDFHNKTTMTYSSTLEHPRFPCISELVTDSFSSNSALISNGNSYHKFNVNTKKPRMLLYSKPAIELNCHQLFTPLMAKFKTRRGENQIVHIINNDILIILKLDNYLPTYSFRKLSENQLFDIDIKCEIY